MKGELALDHGIDESLNVLVVRFVPFEPRFRALRFGFRETLEAQTGWVDGFAVEVVQADSG